MNNWIPLSTPTFEGNEWNYVKECIDTGWVSSVGQFVNRFEEEIANFTGANYAIATMNGTSALHLSLLLAGVQPGDAVIIPSLTFVATANAVAYLGAEPILIDSKSDTWQMDLDLLSEFLEFNTYTKNKVCLLKDSGQKIGAIVPVHVLGNLVDMDHLCSLAERFQIPVVEDSTEALGSTLNGKHAGTFGLFGTLSFNGNKLITTGGGGMILTNQPILAQKAKHLTTQAKADPLEYFHDEIGFNYRLVNILAAIGVAQLEKIPNFLDKHHTIFEIYKNGLAFLPGSSWQKSIPNASPNHWITTICFPKADSLLQYLLHHKIQARKFWVPMHMLPMFKSNRYIHRENISERLYNNAISLPSSSNLSAENQDFIIRKILEFYDQA